jgi:hypothetical protein
LDLSSRFIPVSAATWLLTEIDPDDESVAWGLCDLGMGLPEFGTVSLTELGAYRGRLGLGIERDRYFEARGPISAYVNAATEGDLSSRKSARLKVSHKACEGSHM